MLCSLIMVGITYLSLYVYEMYFTKSKQCMYVSIKRITFFILPIYRLRLSCELKQSHSFCLFC